MIPNNQLKREELRTHKLLLRFSDFYSLQDRWIISFLVVNITEKLHWLTLKEAGGGPK